MVQQSNQYLVIGHEALQESTNAHATANQLTTND